MEGTPEDDDLARAYAAMSTQLNEWTSPMVGTMNLSTRTDDDEEEDEEDVMNWVHQGASPMALTPQKRSGTETPVMSNSKRHQRQPSPLELLEPTDANDVVHNVEPVETVGVQSPWPYQPITVSLTATRSDDHYEYRRYHDALYTYLAARRNISERLRIQQEQEESAVASHDGMLVSQETRIEMDFLQALSAVCLDDMSSPSSKKLREGNLWALLATLRSLGLSSLLFPNDAMDQAHYQEEIDRTISELAMQIHKSPLELLDDLSSKGPLVLRRRKLVLEWMQQCQGLLLSQVTMPPKKQSTMWSASLERLKQGSKQYANKIDSLHPDAPLLVREACQPSLSVTPIDPLYGNDEQDDVVLLKACLALYFCGQMDKAVELCRQCGQPWRAAAWIGGSPHGERSIPNSDTQTMDRVQEGNANRALWKRNCWNLSGTLSNIMAPTGSSVQYEAVMYALLSNDTTTSLSSPVLTTWEQRMQTMFGAMMERVEDSLLYRCNNNRRKTGECLPFPGTEYEREERDQLQCTASIAHLTEQNVCETVASYSSDADDALLSAQAAFIMGKTAVSTYLAKEGTQEVDETSNNLRFLTHLTLYLDSLTASTTSMTVDGLEPVKNAILLQYVRFLASRSDLWRMLALYASLLPLDSLLDCYPSFLYHVEGDAERRGMLKDARELFPPGQDLVILKKVVDFHLSNETDGPRAHVRKMKAVLWLCHYEEHMGDALVFANALLRQFLLRPGMIENALLFVNDYFPDSVTKTVMEQIKSEKDADDEDKYTNALVEHGALECHLRAYSSFQNWQNVVENASFGADNADKHDFPGLQGTEKEIARSMERRDVIRCKRQAGQAVVQAAEEAREKMLQVLEYSGGFLRHDDDEVHDLIGDEFKRRLEGASLRRRCLPQVVFWLHEVCDKTATWMHSFLKDGMPKLGKNLSDVVAALDTSTESGSSPLTPSHWLEHSLNLAVTVASDEYEIHNAFESNETKRFLSLMAETAVKQLQYRESS